MYCALRFSDRESLIKELVHAKDLLDLVHPPFKNYMLFLYFHSSITCLAFFIILLYNFCKYNFVSVLFGIT